ncbi:MAG: hypothetical protein H6708_26625 [Kofleriaceae bacterium]|nr:hypothetical protein [Kofleriaceae bacterium]
MTAPWLDRRLLVCVGAGGVGKTTVSAAIALAAARAGRRALVLTVDPARRLAGALGLSALPGQPAPVPAAALAAAGLDTGGRLDAMMLDQAGAWDRLIARHADDAARARLADSRFFRALSQRFAGATEYLALDELAELTGSGDHDLIVLDTPPGERAIDLLGAPARARALLDPRVLHFLGGAGRLIPGGLEAAAGGAALLLELFGVLSATADVADALAARAAAARAPR